MKIKVLVVDDEPVICKGLRLTIPWTEMGAEVLEAYDGEQALQIMNNISADLILTDVKMPRMNGLELVEHLHNRHFPGKVVMLSGYEEFSYVKKALQFGVKDYLLKPVDADELIGLLNKLLMEIAEEKDRKTARKLEAYYRYMAKEMVENAARDDAAFPEPLSPCRFVVSRIGEYYRLANGTSEPEQTRLRARWKERVDGAFREAGLPSVSLFLQTNLLLTVVPENEDALLSGEAIRHIMDGCSGQELVPGHRLEWMAAEDAVRLQEMKPKVHHLIRLLQQGTNGAAASAGGETDIMRRKSPSAGYPKEIEKTLLDLLFQHKEAEMRHTVRQLFEHFRKHEYTLQEAHLVCQEMYTMAERRLRATAGLHELSRLPDLKTADLQVYNSFAAVEHLFWQALLETSELLKRANIGRNRPIIERVKAYIQQNYAQDLKSYEIADKLRITPNYFSSIFKKETGKSFHEYVNEVRIEKAKELLLTTSELVGTIALAVGYKEYKYFSNIFKKHNGFVPSEYREIHRKTAASGENPGVRNLF
jgi:two-component system response regulator YesN